MNEVISHVVVMGHANPDMDASAAAVCYADFLNRVKRYDREAVGAVPSAPTPQVREVFEKAGVELPLVIRDASPRVGHVMKHDVVVLTENDRVGDALELAVRKDISMIPIMRDDGEILSVFSHRSDASKYLLGFDPTPFWGTLLTLEDIQNVPGMSIVGATKIPRDAEGEFVIAVDGDESWKQMISRSDTVVCASLNSLEDLPETRLPQAVVLLGTQELRGTESLARMDRNGSIVLQYSGSLVAMVQQLTLHIRLGALALPSPAKLGWMDRIDDVQSIIRDYHHALPVVDERGRLKGVVSRSDLAKVDSNHTHVILVDHFESRQSVEGLESTTILEVLDHHRVGDVETTQPIRVNCAPVGSSSTLVAMSYFEHSQPIEPPYAMLLLAGICADTLVLRGPTTTRQDHSIARRLAEIAGVDLLKFGTEVLLAADDLLTADPHEIWNRDQKQFFIRNRHFSVAQLETASLASVPESVLQAFEQRIARDRIAKGDLLSMMVVTDVLEGNSIIFADEEADGQLVGTCFGDAYAARSWIDAPGVVSRKKQVVPPLMKSLALIS